MKSTHIQSPFTVAERHPEINSHRKQIGRCQQESSLGMAQGAPVQVVSAREHKHRPVFELHEEALRQVLCQEEVRDLPVVVISVDGKMRQGKSYLLNLLIRYLRNKDTGDAWLGDETTPLDEPQFCTSGILLWSEVFVLENSNGDKVAVVLMDTQGTFDTASTMKHCSMVFALSTMISSLQIYSIMMDGKRDDLDSLQLFMAYGEAAKAQGSDTKPFKQFCFLVRDRQCSDSHPYGAAGGNQFLRAKVDTDNEILASFEEVSFFLLPYPWRQVETSGRVDGDLTGLGDTFKYHVREYFSQIFSPEKLMLMVKKTAGKTVKTNDIIVHFKAFVQAFQGNGVPTPKSAFEANAHVTMTKAYEMGLKHFEDIKKSLIVSKVDDKTSTHDPKLLQRTLAQCREHALCKFESRAKLGADKVLAEKYRHTLKQDIETDCQYIEQLNTLKMANSDVIKALEEADKQRHEAEIHKEKAIKLVKQLKRQKKEAEKRRRES